MHPSLPTQVDAGEQEIAKLRLDRRVPCVEDWRTTGSDVHRPARDLLAHLLKLLGDFLHRPLDVRPVEADPRGAILKAMRAMQGRKRRGEPLGDRLPLLRLHLLPRDFLSALVEMRMPGTHLRDQRARHVVRRERAPLLGDHRVEEDLEQYVAELLERVSIVAGADRILELVRFLDEIRAQGVVTLCRIPLASRAKITHQGERIFKCRFVLHGLTRVPILPAPRMNRSMESGLTRAWVDIDLGALQRNAVAIAARAGVPILPMVKADAYGLGAVAVARALEPVKPWGFGVATVDEGAELRDAGIARRIMIFTPLADEDLPHVLVD